MVDKETLVEKWRRVASDYEVSRSKTHLLNDDYGKGLAQGVAIGLQTAADHLENTIKDLFLSGCSPYQLIHHENLLSLLDACYEVGRINSSTLKSTTGSL
tara:strand:+ start:124 stop:423 length:300 start_codon:yes stop_codon:yes gene_type:complete